MTPINIAVGNKKEESPIAQVSNYSESINHNYKYYPPLKSGLSKVTLKQYHT